jgi:uncharacterized protein YyaL (SSP411 family)
LGIPAYLETARETLDYLAREMRAPEGGIHAAEDADSEGVEGRYYVWSYEAFRSIAGADADVVGDLYGVTRDGNFEGANNLHVAMTTEQVAAAHGTDPQEVAAAKSRVDEALRREREQRIRPGRDDKVIASWNGLALRAFAEAAAVLEEPRYRDVATGIARFITEELVGDDGRLARSWRQGRTSGPGFCVDYAAGSVGLFTLYQVTGDEEWYHAAVHLIGEMNRLFLGDAGYYSTGSDQAALISRPVEFKDNPLPSANSLAAEALTMFSAFTAADTAGVDAVSRGASLLLERAPHAVPHLLGVLATRHAGIKEVAVVGPDSGHLTRVLWETWRPDCVVAIGDGSHSEIPLLSGRSAEARKATAHVCRSFVCDLPVTTPDDLRLRLAPAD